MKKNHLYVVKPENQILGPVSRLGLWYKFPEVDSTRLAGLILIKLALLATVVYCAKKMGI